MIIAIGVVENPTGELWKQALVEGRVYGGLITSTFRFLIILN